MGNIEGTMSHSPLARGSGGMDDEVDATASLTPLGSVGVTAIYLFAEKLVITPH